YRLLDAFERSVPALVVILRRKDQVAPPVVDAEIMEGRDTHEYGFENIVGTVAIGREHLRDIDIDARKLHPRRTAVDDLLAVHGSRYEHISRCRTGNIYIGVPVGIRHHGLRCDDGPAARVDTEGYVLPRHYLAREIDDMYLHFCLLDPVRKRLIDDHTQCCQRIVDIGLIQEMQDLIAAVDENSISGDGIDDRRIDENGTRCRAGHGDPGHTAVIGDHARGACGELGARDDRAGCRRGLYKEGHLYILYRVSVRIADIGNDAVPLCTVRQRIIVPDKQYRITGVVPGAGIVTTAATSSATSATTIGRRPAIAGR